MNTIASRDQFKPIRIGEKFSGELSEMESEESTYFGVNLLAVQNVE